MDLEKEIGSLIRILKEYKKRGFQIKLLDILTTCNFNNYYE